MQCVYFILSFTHMNFYLLVCDHRPSSKKKPDLPNGCHVDVFKNKKCGNLHITEAFLLIKHAKYYCKGMLHYDCLQYSKFHLLFSVCHSFTGFFLCIYKLLLYLYFLFLIHVFIFLFFSASIMYFVKLLVSFFTLFLQVRKKNSLPHSLQLYLI